MPGAEAGKEEEVHESPANDEFVSDTFNGQHLCEEDVRREMEQLGVKDDKKEGESWGLCGVWPLYGPTDQLCLNACSLSLLMNVGPPHEWYLLWRELLQAFSLCLNFPILLILTNKVIFHITWVSSPYPPPIPLSRNMHAHTDRYASPSSRTCTHTNSLAVSTRCFCTPANHQVFAGHCLITEAHAGRWADRWRHRRGVGEGAHERAAGAQELATSSQTAVCTRGIDLVGWELPFWIFFFIFLSVLNY